MWTGAVGGPLSPEGLRRARRALCWWLSFGVTAVLLVAGATAYVVGLPRRPDGAFTERLLTAIGARTTGGSVQCDIPGDLDVGRSFACHGTNGEGGYTVEVLVTDARHDFRLLFSKPV